MTVALGSNFGDYAFLASDSRATFYDLDGTARSFEDDQKKIYKTKLGILTGAGSIPLLEAVKDQLENNEKFNQVTDTNSIQQVIKEALLNYSKSYWLTQARDVKITGWIFTYNAIIENKPKLRLTMVHPADAKEIALIQENKPAVIYPCEASPEQVNIIHQCLEKNIKPLHDFSSINDSIQYHTAIIANIIRQIQPTFPIISPYFQIGVHTLGGVGISEIIQDNKPFNFELQLNSK